MARVPAIRAASAAGTAPGNECVEAFVAAMATLHVPVSARPSWTDFTESENADPGRLVECVLFLKYSEEVMRSLMF
jgi:hypothetical protein